MLARETFHGLQQPLHAVVTDPRVQKALIRLERLRLGQVAIRSGEERLQRRQIERQPAIDDMVRQPHQRDDAEQFARAHVVPVQHRRERTVVAVLHVAQHPADQAYVREFRQAFGAAVAFVQHVERLNVQAELRGRINPLRDGRIKTVQAIQEQNLSLLQLDRLRGNAPPFLEAIHGFLNRPAVQ